MHSLSLTDSHCLYDSERFRTVYTFKSQPWNLSWPTSVRFINLHSLTSVLILSSHSLLAFRVVGLLCLRLWDENPAGLSVFLSVIACSLWVKQRVYKFSFGLRNCVSLPCLSYLVTFFQIRFLWFWKYPIMNNSRKFNFIRYTTRLEEWVTVKGF